MGLSSSWPGTDLCSTTVSRSRPETTDCELTCRACGGPLAGREGRFAYAGLGVGTHRRSRLTSLWTQRGHAAASSSVRNGESNCGRGDRAAKNAATPASIPCVVNIDTNVSARGFAYAVERAADPLSSLSWYPRS